MKKRNTAVLAMTVLIVLSSCRKDETPDPVITTVKTWDINMSSNYEVPPPTGVTAFGRAILKLNSDYTLSYEINVGKPPGDNFGAMHLHSGNLTSIGNVIFDIAPDFSKNPVSGKTSQLRSTLIDSLLSAEDIYLNIHSVLTPSGLLRGQVNKIIDTAFNVNLQPVPPATAPVSGRSFLRLTTQKILYVNYTLANLQPTDSILKVYLKTKATGDTLLDLTRQPAQAGSSSLLFTVSDLTISRLKNSKTEIIVQTRNFPNGMLKGDLD